MIKLMTQVVSRGFLISGILFCPLFSSIANADDKIFEIWTGSLGSMNLTNSNAKANLTFSSMGSGDPFNTANPTIGLILNSNVEIVFSPSFGIFNYSAVNNFPGGSYTVIDPQLGVNFSFGPTHGSSFYIQAEGGVSIASATWTPGYPPVVSFSLAVQVGKRFHINESVTYAPAVEYLEVLQTPVVSSLSFIPVQFTFFM